jgi:hypothetical protein
MCLSIFFNQLNCKLVFIIEEIEEKYQIWSFDLLNNKRLDKTTTIIPWITKHDKLQELKKSNMQNTTPSKINSGLRNQTQNISIKNAMSKKFNLYKKLVSKQITLS